MRTKRGPRSKHPIPTLRDGALLSGRPPDLWGIVPFSTPIEEARAILAEKGVLKACRDYHATTGATGIACWPHFNLQYEHGVVKFVEFRPADDITAAQVLHAHGTPDGVLSCYTDFPDGKVYTVMLLFYDRLWTIVSLREQVERTYKVSPDTPVSRITYSRPVEAITRASIRIAWRGFGNYPASDATSD